MDGATPASFDRILSSMCTVPHPDAVELANTFLTSNPGDPASFPEISRLETEAITRLGHIAGLREAYGYITSGGTEANIQAVRIARNLRDSAIPNIVVPESGHFSFAKAAEVLNVDIRWSPVDASLQADVDGMAELVDSNTILVGGIAGSTEYGRVDPIPAIADLATTHGIHMHVDAAWGGFLLPFSEYDWSFADAEIDTMTIDPHKYGRAAIPAGGLLARSSSLIEALQIETPYLESQSQISLQGTRSGAGVASVCAAVEALWPDGYRKQYERASSHAAWLAEAFSDRGYNVIDPVLPIVSVSMQSNTFNALRKRGWKISRTAAGELRIVCMPHIDRSILTEFLADLDRIEDRAR